MKSKEDGVKKTTVKMVNLSFMGTGHHRETHDNHIIAHFFKEMEQHAKASGDVAVRLFDGVGSSPILTDGPGTYLYDPETGKKIPIDAKITHKISDAIQRLTGIVAGDGVENLLLEATLFINKIIQENYGVLLKSINMQGFSRGADTCLRMANILDQLYPEIEVNLFLIDQVPGPGRRDAPPSYTIPANVKRFESALMFHEYRPGFDPQHEGRYVFASPESTMFSIKHYYDAHGIGTKLNENKDKNHTVKLIHDDLDSFCRATGEFPEDAPVPGYVQRDGTRPTAYKLDSAERFAYYCNMRENECLYAKGKKYNQRTILTQQKDSINQAHIFINQEHRQLFKENYPKVFNWLFEKNSNPTISKEDVINELNKLNIAQPNFSKLLAKSFKYKETKFEQTLLAPQGVSCDEQPVLGEPLIRDQLSYLRYSLRTIANFYHYHLPGKKPINNAVEEALLALVKRSYQLPKDQAVAFLTEGKERIMKYLEKNNEQGFIAQQMILISPDPISYVANVIATLEGHLDNNLMLSFVQKEDIRTAIKKLQALHHDETLENREKYHEMRKEVIALNARVTSPEDDETYIQNMMQEAYHTPVIGEAPTHSLKSFSADLNRLSLPGFGEISVATKLLHQLDAYKNRNSFWNSIKEIFNSLYLPFPQVFSGPKNAIAIELRETIIDLESRGLGNDLNAIE